MMLERLEQTPPLFPLEFFSLRADVAHAKQAPSGRVLRRSFLLPSTASLLGEESFAEVALAWSFEGIFVGVFVEKPFEEASYPQFAASDALELFFDTRDLKSAGFMTRFCHHFVVLPQAVQGIRVQELTHFRTEDTHPLCDPQEISIEATFEKRAYALQLFFPSNVLHGYDPHAFERLGFTYRLHRCGGRPQHFAVSSEHFQIEQQPRLWASLYLQKE